jgi:hypothetical protein
MESQSLNDFLKQLQAENIDANSRQAAEKFDTTKITKPYYSTKVGVYEHLQSLGLSNESPLFGKVFESFGSDLKLK